MAFRNVIVSSPARISLKNSQLIIKTEAEHSLPPEDISALLIESRESTLTAAALSRLGEGGCAVFFCDEKHMPCAVLQPFSCHSRAPEVLKAQINMGEVLRKRLWQSIVRAKIENQARCLSICGCEQAAEGLFSMAEDVRSGDSSCREAAAAQRYFPALFGKGFLRRQEGGINSGLNYCYAILRGCIARCLAVSGFQPSLGIHHRSGLNAFNLADDLIEPFRPLADLLVSVCFEGGGELDRYKKQQLFNCLNLDILSGAQHHSAAYAAERLVQSLGRSLETGEAELVLPELQELRQHSYE